MEKKITRYIRKNKAKLIGIVISLIIILLSFIFLRGSDVFYFIFGIAFVIGGLPFFISLILENNKSRKKDEMFLEFARDFGPLKPYVEKLANQIALGIPVQSAFNTFARDINSPTVYKAVTIMGESEKAGGQIEDILESVVKSVSQIEVLKKERRATMYNLVVQGYIIFLIFIAIMLVMQFKVLPIAAQLGGEGGGSGIPISLGGFGSGEIATPEELAMPFLYLLIVQGLFAGLVIGKISEGKIKQGLKHSFILVVLALLISTGAKLFLG